MEWSAIGETAATDRLYCLKVACLIFKNASPILPKAHCFHYKDEPESALYLRKKKRCFSGDHTKSTIQLFIPGIIQNPQSNCLFRESYKIHNPAVYSGNHSKPTVQLFVQEIIQSPQSSRLFRESFKIHSPAVCLRNHSKSTVQLSVPGITQNPQSSSLSPESHKILNPLSWKTRGLLLKHTPRALTIVTYRHKNWRRLLPVLVCLQCGDR
jgi:hypothetical protein